jgi:hypothetical protein
LVTSEKPENAQLKDEPETGAAMLKNEPWRLKLVSARATAATKRGVETAMVMLAADMAEEAQRQRGEVRN